MGINITQSHQIERLFEHLLARLSIPVQNPLQLLKPQFFLVPSHGMGKWLEYQVAERLGISANVELQQLRTFQWNLYQRVLGKARTSAAPQLLAMTWQIYKFLSEYLQQDLSQVALDHPLHPILKRVYHYGLTVEQPEQQRIKQQDMLYWVSDTLARLFANYVIYRGQCMKGCGLRCQCPENWLAYWARDETLPIPKLVRRPEPHVFEQHPESLDFAIEQAEELEAWQRYVWYHVFAEDFHKIQQVDLEFWQTLNDPIRQLAAVASLPQQIYVFTLLELPPAQLFFLRRLAAYVDIHIYHYNPTQEYWADSVDPKWHAQQQLKRQLQQSTEQQGLLNTSIDFRESRHPLLTRLGKQSRDIFAQLSQLAGGEEGDWQDDFDVLQTPTQLLAYIQDEILNLAEPEQGQFVLSPEDESIQVHVCHSSLRQLEVLKEHLIAWLAADSSRQPTDILVLVPNLKDIEAHIRTVFSPSIDRNDVYLPIRIAGVSQRDALQVWQMLLGRFQLLHGRFSIDVFIDWLSLPATQQHYELTFDEVKRLTLLLSEAGFKRGFDDVHLQQSLAEHDQDLRFSLRYALDRLTLAVAIPERMVFADVLSMPVVQPEDFPLIGVLIQIYQDFDARRHDLAHVDVNLQKTIQEWIVYLDQEIESLSAHDIPGLAVVKDAVVGFKRIIHITHAGDRQLPLQYVLAEIQDTLEHQTAKSEPTGHITFAQMGQLRPMPYRLMVCLNLDMGLFPNRDTRIPFDLMEYLYPQLGDRSRLEDDQGAFLDMLLQAKEACWLFYNGFSTQDAELRDPSSILQELLEHLAWVLAAPTENATEVTKSGVSMPAQLADLYHIHPLQPFDRQDYQQQPVRRFADHWYVVAKTMHEPLQHVQAWYESEHMAQPERSDDSAQAVQVLSADAWIRDLSFPARHFLRSHGISQAARHIQLEVHEPLALDALSRYVLRDAVQQQVKQPNEEQQNPIETVPAVVLQDHLPIGKMQHASWHLVQQEQQYLQARLAKYGGITPLTVRRYQHDAQIEFQIQVPEQIDQFKWVSLATHSASRARPLQVWLEYLLWRSSVAHDVQRIALFSNVSLKVQGLSQSDAQHYLNDWIEIWQIAAEQPVFLPPALLADMKTELKWDFDDEQRPFLTNYGKIEEQWLDLQFKRFAFDPTENEACCKHLDWAVLLQHKEPQLELNKAIERHAYRLYAPLKKYVEVVNDAT